LTVRVAVGGAAGAEGDESNCVSPGISAASLLIDLPPLKTIPEVEELPALAAASGMVPVDAVPTAMDLVVVVDDGAMLMVARGAAAPTLLLSDDSSLD
jgi:hypothetical protein